MSPTSTSSHSSEPLPILLANTVSIARGRVEDALADPSKVNGWVGTTGEQFALFPPPSSTEHIDESDAVRLVSLRDAVRRLAAEKTRDPRTLGQSPVTDVATATSILNASAALGSVWPELQWHGPEAFRRDVWADGTYVDALTTIIARQTMELMTSPQWDRLRPCLAPGCAYFFVKDHLRRQWCAAACGNRARVARHAQRHSTD
ncbi:hypothetical protein MARA_01960 (plasmid) [Mycolicibacterium arabiense]|uniref:Zinc finger CGNR domain-containing protein n=1 Tax=Mycolicibacterium arabiense TaxID=1286181 RepID=A0A7I7RRT5_9MYCO|nr:ABATE domain-containing protein [Mycolicibacterium arabiense]MCV7376955.1 ABATE domain-containing protein [Mycolicibacterium arabiense]BBY46766.1 hypothetical protein MARA_01960 [Mycolicibacterium arabiense]